MPLVSKAAYERFERDFASAPNNLTKVLRSHHAVEAELHASLGMYLVLSPRLDLRKIPFLTKVDLLISLGALGAMLYPFFAEINRLRNRFAHDPDAELLEDDAIKVKNLYSSCAAVIAPENWELGIPGKAIGALFQTVCLASRSTYERVVNMRAQSRALDCYIAEKHPSISDANQLRFRTEIDKEVAAIARDLLIQEHPDVDFRDLYVIDNTDSTS